MSLAQLTAGFVKTLAWSAPDLTSVKRHLSDDEVDTRIPLALRNALSNFWDSFGLNILVAPGLPGCNRSIAWQAGHDLAFAINDRRPFNRQEWGAVLAVAMNTRVANMGGRIKIEIVGGAITITRGG